MATKIISRLHPKTLTPFFSRSLSTTCPSLRRLRPLAAASIPTRHLFLPSIRSLSTRATTSSHNDPNPNTSNRPTKEAIALDGCDMEHWLIMMEKPEGEPSREEIIDGYIKTLAQVLGSEEEARMKIYSVSTKHYFAFGALVSEELSFKIKELPKVTWVLPDSYLNVREKDYGGEPFINGQAVPYDPKYHEEWVRNNAQANNRNNRNARPRRDNAGGPGNNGGGYRPNNNASGYPPRDGGHGRGGRPQNNYAGNRGGVPPNQNAGWSNNGPARDAPSRDRGVAVGGGNTYNG
ncbi:multiple organellar RNA editing factor 8, chloroplastic/mitochondrial-like [Lotus japonicus]|uniref:multiple organellar RNA editing factor 8, chloroplastic/mitochondrial-like n=1 Tax=Lotus japonicus TaxID=34305 RepID=UPI0025863CC5|nr:multiple organellar RNA editing factor 8, chloroplastic/mitochondrial-like [Lotus japonicus]